MAEDKLIIPYWLVRELVARMTVTIKRRRKTQPERTEMMREWRKHNACPAIESIMKVGNELRLVVVSCLIHGPLRFNELLETAKGVDPRSLSRVLKFLASEGIVKRDVLSTQPFAVQYSLTEKGKQLEPVVEALRTWGERWLIPQEVIVSSPGRPLASNR
jgi:DNA-binding HxlR family transcriptional regulator